MISSNMDQLFKSEIEKENAEINTADNCLHKLKQVRKEKENEKQTLLKQLQDVSQIIANLDDKIEYKENMINTRRQVVKFKQNLISK
jgi:hypothetical protein